MGRNKIRHFSSEEKTKIVLALLKEDLTVSQLSSKYGITSKTIQNWGSVASIMSFCIVLPLPEILGIMRPLA